jgi:hypothetical protein
MTLEVYYPDDTMRYYAPGWVDQCPGCATCQWYGGPHYIFIRLEGPVRSTL